VTAAIRLCPYDNIRAVTNQIDELRYFGGSVLARQRHLVCSFPCISRNLVFSLCLPDSCTLYSASFQVLQF
jgi:hypothetical protein